MSRRSPLQLAISPHTNSPSGSRTSPRKSPSSPRKSPSSSSSPGVVSGDSDIAGYMTLSSLDRSNSRQYAIDLRKHNASLSTAEAMQIARREYIAAKKAATVALRVVDIAEKEVKATKERLIREGKARSLAMGKVGAAKQQAKEEKLQRSITLGQERLRRAGINK
jgi:hypothetical protein